MLRIEFAGDTHVGQKRETNQDSLLMLPEENLFAVADGMGGHLAGEVASSLAVETISGFYQESSRDSEITWPFRPISELGYQENRLITAIKLANRRVYETSLSDKKYKGMGTTAVVIQFIENELLIGHVGDSRAYLFRGGKLTQITEDHSLLNDFKKNIKMTEEDERRFPYKNIIVRALGMKDAVEVDLLKMTPRVGDMILLCSDGLNGELNDETISGVLKDEPSLRQACDRLIDESNLSGGRDNVTVVLVRFVDSDQTDLDDLNMEITAELTRQGY